VARMPCTYASQGTTWAVVGWTHGAARVFEKHHRDQGVHQQQAEWVQLLQFSYSDLAKDGTHLHLASIRCLLFCPFPPMSLQ
jgi:hypothetical protein